MTTLGEKSLELIRESLRSQDMIGPFNEEKVRAVLEEIKALHDEVCEWFVIRFEIFFTLTSMFNL